MTIDYMKDIKELSINKLLYAYKTLARKAPNVMYASDKEIDDYYEDLNRLEEEIISRTKEE